MAVARVCCETPAEMLSDRAGNYPTPTDARAGSATFPFDTAAVAARSVRRNDTTRGHMSTEALRHAVCRIGHVVSKGRAQGVSSISALSAFVALQLVA